MRLANHRLAAEATTYPKSKLDKALVPRFPVLLLNRNKTGAGFEAKILSRCLVMRFPSLFTESDSIDECFPRLYASLDDPL
jgi:hypothetical protein